MLRERLEKCKTANSGVLPNDAVLTCRLYRYLNRL